MKLLLVVDAMTGQDAVTVAEAFNKALGITGLIVTKLDGDARGGAVLSVKSVADCPVKFVGMGEKAGCTPAILSGPHGFPHPWNGGMSYPLIRKRAPKRPLMLIRPRDWLSQ